MQSVRVYSICFNMLKKGDAVVQRIRVAPNITATLLLVDNLFYLFIVYFKGQEHHLVEEKITLIHSF